MKIKELHYNWFPGGSFLTKDGVFENWTSITVGKNNVVEITEHLPQGEGDAFYYIIKYEDGHCMRIFNPNTVEYFPD